MLNSTTRGCYLTYWTDGQGSPALLIQGTGVHGEGWRPQIGALKADYRCAWFDNRGIGASNPPGTAAISMEQLALDAIAVMDDLGWDSAHLMGHSLGGCIALEVALQKPQRVRSLAVLCSAAMPSAKYVQLPGAHGVPITAPATINDLLRKHIAAVGGR